MPHRSKLTLVGLGGYTTRALLRAKVQNAVLRNLSRPIRTVLRWQLIATAALALIAGVLAGGHGALSAALGGAVSIFAGLASAVVATMGRAKSAEAALIAVLRAEAVKIGLIVVLLWLVLANYRDVAVVVFISSFVVTVVIFAMAFFVREY